MTRIAIAILVCIAGFAAGSDTDSVLGIAFPLAIGFAAVGIYVWLDLRSRDLPPATRRELAAAHRRNRPDLRGALRRNERTT